MIVDMLIVTCSGTFPHIESHVETVRIVDGAENFDATVCERGHFARLVLIKLRNTGDMTIWRDHEVTVIIGENIHEDETVFTRKKDKILFIIASSRQDAENTLIRLILGNVFHAPGGPEAFHKLSTHYQFD